MKKASPGFTYATCHGCGETPSSYGGRRKDEVCGNCQALLRFAKKTHEHHQALEETVSYQIPSHWHDLPYLPHCPSSSFGQRDTIQRAFHTLLKMVSEPCGHSYSVEYAISPSKHLGYIENGRMSPVVREQINILYNALIVALNDAYAEGKRDGENFITALAKGEVSIDKFNDAVTRK